MRKLGHIIRGWLKATGVVSTNSAEQKLSALRLRECDRCSYSENKKVLEIINGNANYEHSLVCNKCKCPCLQKSLVVDEHCPIGRW